MNNHWLTKYLFLYFLLSTALPIYAETSLYSVEDLVYQQDISEPFQISPDGQKVAWIRHAFVTNRADYQTIIFVTTLTNGLTRQISDGLYSVEEVAWSPNGEKISFLSPGNTEAQGLWFTTPTGGVPQAVVTGVVGLVNYGWRDDEHIIFTAAAITNTPISSNNDDTVVADAPETPINLFQVDLTSQAYVPLRTNIGAITKVAVFSNQVAIEWKSSSYSWRYGSNNWARYYLLALGADYVSGEIRIFANAIDSDDMVWAPDGKRLYLLKKVYDDESSNYVKVNDVIYRDIASQQESIVPLAWSNSLAYPFSEIVATTNGFCTLLANGVHPQLARYTFSGGYWGKQIVTALHQGNIFTFSLDDSGSRIVYKYSTLTKSPQLYRAVLNGNEITDPILLTDLNPTFSNKVSSLTQVVHLNGARGDSVEGWLYYPVNYQPGQKYPIVLFNHGGPFEAFYDYWPHILLSCQLFAQQGAFTLMLNFHGSSDYGLAWAASPKNGHYYELTAGDCLLALSELTAQGLIDRDRMAIWGWSYGAILSFALIASNNNFRAVSAGAGCSEWLAEWAYAEPESSSIPYFFGGEPTAIPNAYMGLSPFYALTNVTTPVLMYLSTEDAYVLPAASWTTYRGLSLGSHAALRMLMFPNDSHVPTMRSHVLRKLNEDRQWFAQFLFASNMPLNQAVSGNVNTTGTTNWYQLSAINGTSYTLAMSNAPTGVVAYLFDRQNNLLGEINNSNRSWTASYSGWYYFGVSGSVTGTYNIAVVKTNEVNRTLPWIQLLIGSKQ